MLPMVSAVGPAHAPVMALDVATALVLAGAVAMIVRRRSLPWAVAGLAALLVAALPPVHDLAEGDVAWHMVQHLLLTAVAAPALGVALADVVVRAPQVARGIRRGVLARWAPVGAAVAHVAVLVAWHVPALYDAAVATPVLHAAEHATLLATALWFWAAVAHHARRRAAPVALLGLFVVATGGAAFGVLLMFLDRPVYALAETLTEQQVAGALMAGGGALGTGAAAMAVLVALIGRGDHRARLPSRAGLASAALLVGMPAGAAVAALADQPAGAQAAPAQVAGAGDQEEGMRLYARDCAWCHGVDGQGTPRGMGLEGVGAAGVDYALTTGRMPIAAPDDEIRRRDPAYTSEEISALVAHAATLVGGPPVPVVDVDGADVARGGELYRRNCASCHGSTGIGGALAFDQLTPHVLASTPVQVAEAIVVGPGTMPAFGQAVEGDDLDAVAAYVLELQDPVTGGIALPGSRVAEGLVAWVVGVGVLVLAARWIGTRA